MAVEQEVALTLTRGDVLQILMGCVLAIWFLIRLVVTQERQRIDQLLNSLEKRVEAKVESHQQLMDEKFDRLMDNMTEVSKGLNSCTNQMHYLNNQLGIFNTRLDYLKPPTKE